MPRSPWLASAACTKKAGVPVEASVAAILRAMCPDLPMPVTIRRPCACRMVSTAATNESPSPSAMAAFKAAKPSRPVSSVRSAEATKGCAEASFWFTPAELFFALIFESMLDHAYSVPPMLSPRRRRSLLVPGRERFREGAIARCALLQCQDRASTIGVDDRDIEPRPLLEQLNIALLVGLDRRKPDQKEAVGHLHGEASERRAARLFGLLHQDARHIGDAAAGEIGREVEQYLDRMA